MTRTAEESDYSNTNLPHESFSEGLIHVYTGNGKGKTTAALGLAIRAIGQGLRVYIAQFMKGVPYGELSVLANINNIVVRQFGRVEWVHFNSVSDDDRVRAADGLRETTKAMQSGQYDIMVLDEVNLAVAWGLIPIADFMQFVTSKPKSVELVLTGRLAPSEIIEMADYVTEMREIKHPYKYGLTSRRGIEF